MFQPVVKMNRFPLNYSHHKQIKSLKIFYLIKINTAKKVNILKGFTS